MSPKRLLHVENWLKTPADRDIIARWTHELPSGTDPGDGHRLDLAAIDGAGLDWEFLALGDTGDADAAGPGEAPQDAVAREMACDAVAPAGVGRGRFVVHTGDVVYMTGERRLYERNFRRPYAPFLTPESTTDNLLFTVPLLPIPGNHDYYDLRGWARWLARVPLLAPGLRAVAHEMFAFGLPEGGSDMGRGFMEAFVDQDRSASRATLKYEPGVRTRLPNRYYQFTVGGVDFFALDSNTLDAPLPSVDPAVVRQAAEVDLHTLEARARQLDAVLRRAQEERVVRRQRWRAALAGDPERSGALTGIATHAGKDVADLYGALRSIAGVESRGAAADSALDLAQRRWREATADLNAAMGTEDVVRVLEQLDEAGDAVCHALSLVEAAEGLLTAGADRDRLSALSEVVARSQAAFASASGPAEAEEEARLHALSEEALDVQRELALERRRSGYRAEDYDHAQLEWLEAALRASERDRPQNWRVVYLHHPLYTTIGNHCERPDVLGLRANLLPLLQERGGVHLVLSGHSHAFEWFRSDALPNAGIFVTGGGGQISLRPSLLESGHWHRHRSRYVALVAAGVQECAVGGHGPAAPDGAAGPLYHYLRIRVQPDLLEVRPVGVRWLRDRGRVYRREEPMPLVHGARLPAGRRPPIAVQALGAVQIRRDQPPRPIWQK